MSMDNSVATNTNNDNLLKPVMTGSRNRLPNLNLSMEFISQRELARSRKTSLNNQQDDVKFGKDLNLKKLEAKLREKFRDFGMAVSPQNKLL